MAHETMHDGEAGVCRGWGVVGHLVWPTDGQVKAPGGPGSWGQLGHLLKLPTNG